MENPSDTAAANDVKSVKLDYYKHNSESKHIDHNDVNRLLTRDAICRKTQRWHLLNEDEMQQMLLKTVNYRAYSFDVQQQIASKSSNSTKSYVSNKSEAGNGASPLEAFISSYPMLVPLIPISNPINIGGLVLDSEDINKLA